MQHHARGTGNPSAPLNLGASEQWPPHPIAADGWTRAGYNGLLLIKKELGAEVAFAENIPAADFEKQFDQFVQAGFDLVIGRGGQFVVAGEKAAARYPRTAFAISGKYAGNNRNLGAMMLRESEMGFLVAPAALEAGAAGAQFAENSFAAESPRTAGGAE